MHRISILSLFSVAFSASVATANPLADMHGSWRGEGWAKETTQAPRERIRCRLDNTYDATTMTLAVTGKCAVPGRQLTLAGSLTGDATTERVTGRWSNPDGIGSVRINGVQRDGIVAFNFAAKDLKSGEDVAQNVEWRVSPDELRLRSTDRAEPDIFLSDLIFSR